MSNRSKESIPILVDSGADINLKNQKDLCSCNLSVQVGVEDDSIQDTFFEAINVVDSREFPLKQKFKNRAIVGVSNFFCVLMDAYLFIYFQQNRVKDLLVKIIGKNLILNMLFVVQQVQKLN